MTDNEGGGDCLFAVIRDALKSADKDVSVMELRKKLSSEATEEIYKNYIENQFVGDKQTVLETFYSRMHLLMDRIAAQKAIVENRKDGKDGSDGSDELDIDIDEETESKPEESVKEKKPEEIAKEKKPEEIDDDDLNFEV